MGRTLTFESTDSELLIVVNEFDGHFNETIALVGDFLRNVQADDKKLQQVVDEAKVAEKSRFNSYQNMADMLLEKIKSSEQSRYLTELSLAEIKKLKGKQLLETFTQARSVECDLHYCGTLPTAEVVEQLNHHLPLEEVRMASHSPFVRELTQYDKPLVFFLNMPNIAQSILYGYMYIDPLQTREERHLARLFNGYFGGDMSSLMFQEIREFRSFAYQVNAKPGLPPLNHAEMPTCFVMKLATQTDKMLDAMQALKDLVRKMPIRPERIQSVKQSIRNWANNEYPTNRSLSLRIAGFRQEGYVNDPNKDYLEVIGPMTMDDITHFYHQHIQNRLITYAIVGNDKKTDMERLAHFGEIVKLTRKDIYR